MKTLLVDYSWSNTTAQLATVVQQVTGAERLDLTVAKGTFPNDMYATSDVAQQQLASGDLPALTTPLPDFNQYTCILVGGRCGPAMLQHPFGSFCASYKIIRERWHRFIPVQGHREIMRLTLLASCHKYQLRRDWG